VGGAGGVKFLLELASEEIPARMQAAAAEQLRTRFVDGLKAAGLAHGEVVADATPRRLWLISDDVAVASAASVEERKGPAATAPEAAIAGFLRSTGLTREQLEERQTPKGVVLFAQIASPGRDAAAILAELVPAMVRDFQWPKSMRWGQASVSTASPRWVRPLTGIVAMLDGDVVPCEVHGIVAGKTTRGHRIHAPEPVVITNPDTYAAQLLAAKVVVSSAERRGFIVEKAGLAAAARGLSVVPDAGLVAENAGLTEWPVPMLGAFDPAFLAVPREVIQLTMRTNQKYFAVVDAAGALAPGFVCVANLEASDGGKAIVAGNERVLSARLSDAKFFWDQDVAAVTAGGLEAFLPKLSDIVFHEKLGTVADKVERLAKLARWLVESGAVAGDADLAEQAARLCKADLVSATVGEFPEVQGIAGAYLARVAGLDPQVADAIRDHYKPVGQGDDVPTAPVSVAVALADKLDTLAGFFAINERPTGSRDPFALRRQALGVLSLVSKSRSLLSVSEATLSLRRLLLLGLNKTHHLVRIEDDEGNALNAVINPSSLDDVRFDADITLRPHLISKYECYNDNDTFTFSENIDKITDDSFCIVNEDKFRDSIEEFLFERMRVKLRDEGVRPDVINAVIPVDWTKTRKAANTRLLVDVFDPENWDTATVGFKPYMPVEKPIWLEEAARSLSRLLALEAGQKALYVFRRCVNILAGQRVPQDSRAAVEIGAPEEAMALARWLESLESDLHAALATRNFSAAIDSIASGKPIIDAFFEKVMVNDQDERKRVARLRLLERVRDAVLRVADFSKIEG
jgi:glycyl-tRNA synthetase beta chain